MKMDSWTCHRCTAIVQQFSSHCEVCNTRRRMPIPIFTSIPICSSNDDHWDEFYGDVRQLLSCPIRANKKQQAAYYFHNLVSNDVPDVLARIIVSYASTDVNLHEVYDVLDVKEAAWHVAEVIDFEECTEIPDETIVLLEYDCDNLVLQEWIPFHSYRIAPVNRYTCNKESASFSTRDCRQFGLRQKAEYVMNKRLKTEHGSGKKISNSLLFSILNSMGLPDKICSPAIKAGGTIDEIVERIAEQMGS